MKAIVCYVDKSRYIETEFTWLFKTWYGWRLCDEYDLVVFKHPDVELPYKHDKLKEINMDTFTKQDPWKTYPWVNSFAMFLDAEWMRDAYTHIMRTDADVFLTENMRKLNPDKVMFGRGAYHFDDQHNNVKSHLDDIQRRWSLNDNSLRHVGSTIFGPSKHVIDYSNLQYRLTKQIVEEEFADGEGKWPGWYRGVSSMYGGYLAANQLFNASQTKMWVLDDHPYGATIDKSMLHIHAWPGDGVFCKHRHHDRPYDKLELTDMPTTTDKYCQWIATNDHITVREICSKYF